MISFKHILSCALALTLIACERVPVLDGASRKVDAAKARNDGPAIWTVRDDDSTLYLFGTVHLLPEGIRWDRDDAKDAFNRSGTLFFEADTSDSAALRAQALATRLGLRSDGRRLSDTLDNYQRNLLEAVSNNGDIPLATLDAMQPWLATEFITLSAAEGAGLSAGVSPDEALRSRADRSGKAVVFLESPESQIRQVADLPEATQLALLTNTMERFDETGDMLTSIARDWSVGDAVGLEATLTAPLAEAPDGYADAVLFARNRNWAEQFDRFLQGSGTGFAVIGTAHLLGEGSLRDEMETRGYDVARYYAFMGEDVITPVDASIPETPSATD